MKHSTLFAVIGSTVLAALLFTGCASAPTAGTGASFKGPIGLQLYSLRADFKKDVPGTMARVAGAS